MASKDYYKKVLESFKLNVNEDVVDDVFGKVAFGGVPNRSKSGKILKLQGLSPVNTNREADTERETTLFDALNDWTGSSSREVVSVLYKFKDLIRAAQKKFPGLFNPSTSNGTILYRGLDEVSSKLAAKLGSTTREDWQQLKSSHGVYWVCMKPVTYTPRKKCQSWTDSFRIASNGFLGEGLLVTKQSDEFMINQDLLQIIFSGRSEREVIHFGTEFKNKVYVAVSDDVFHDEILKRMLRLQKGMSKLDKLQNIAKVVKL